MASCMLVPAIAAAQEAGTEAATPPAQGGLALDWTTGAVFGDVPAYGGAHGLGVEARGVALGLLELDGRYELLGIERPGEMGTALSHQLLGQLKLRWITDEARRHVWALGVGYGVAFRGDSLGGRASLARVALTRQIGVPKGPADIAVELAYERSLGDMSLEMLSGSIRFGITSGPDSRYFGPKSVSVPRTVSLDVYAPGGIGMTFDLRLTRVLRLATSGSFLADVGLDNTDLDFSGFRGAQWALQTGPRIQLPRWPVHWAVAYGQVQAGVGWLAEDPGERAIVQTGELGVRFVCSDFGADLGAWVRTRLDDGSVDAIAGGLVLRILVASDRDSIGGDYKRCSDVGSGGSGGGRSETKSVRIGSGSGIAGIDIELPSPRIESVAPRAGFVWIGGHWQWSGSSWQWVSGRWEAERPGMRWVPGTYEIRGGVHVWVEGRWAPR